MKQPCCWICIDRIWDYLANLAHYRNGTLASPLQIFADIFDMSHWNPFCWEVFCINFTYLWSQNLFHHHTLFLINHWKQDFQKICSLFLVILFIKCMFMLMLYVYAVLQTKVIFSSTGTTATLQLFFHLLNCNFRLPVCILLSKLSDRVMRWNTDRGCCGIFQSCLNSHST